MSSSAPRVDTTTGAASERNFTALPIRFWKTAVSSVASPSTVGSSPDLDAAPDLGVTSARL